MNVNTTWTMNDTSTLEPPLGGGTMAGEASSVAGYCGQDFKAVGNAYRDIHGYTSLVVCVFGALANILNLIVLTRKEMINPTNAILTGLALADLLNMVEYIPFAIYMNFLPDESTGGQRKTYGWAIFVLIHSNFSQVAHTISIWLTLTLAVWRYIMVAMPLKCKTLCTMERAKWAITSAYLASPLLCIPIYLTFSILAIDPSKLKSGAASGGISAGTNETASSTTASYLSDGIDDNDPYNFPDDMSSSNATLSPPPEATQHQYIVHLSDLAKSYPILMNANFWLYSVVIKIIPCILLTVVSFRLINSLMEAKKRKEKLLANKRAGNAAAAQAANTASPATSSGARNNNHAPPRGAGEESGGSDRTTRMLLAVLLLFLITEFPQGLLALLSGLLGDNFFKSCYIPIADLMDFIALLNSAINFILYCSMSKKFRDTFSKVFGLDEVAKRTTEWRLRRRRRREELNNHNHINSPNCVNRSLLGNQEQTAV